MRARLAGPVARAYAAQLAKTALAGGRGYADDGAMLVSRLLDTGSRSASVDDWIARTNELDDESMPRATSLDRPTRAAGSTRAGRRRRGCALGAILTRLEQAIAEIRSMALALGLGQPLDVGELPEGRRRAAHQPAQHPRGARGGRRRPAVARPRRRASEIRRLSRLIHHLAATFEMDTA